tara:strand:- start:29 stop:211 length:183 start_codon:yes stop_codon:yes gene_type:complete
MNNRLNWRKQKTLAMLSNKRQWNEEFNPDFSTALEIETEDGNYLVRESSTSGSPIYIITE